MKKTPEGLLALFVVTLAACATTPHAPLATTPETAPVLGDRGSDMAADLVLVRPLGLVGTVLGTAGFIVSLPFTLPSGSAGEAAHQLVGRPFEYTFNRPLGDFDRCGADRHPCGGVSGY